MSCTKPSAAHTRRASKMSYTRFTGCSSTSWTTSRRTCARTATRIGTAVRAVWVGKELASDDGPGQLCEDDHVEFERWVAEREIFAHVANKCVAYMGDNNKLFQSPNPFAMGLHQHCNPPPTSSPRHSTNICLSLCSLCQDRSMYTAPGKYRCDS